MAASGSGTNPHPQDKSSTQPKGREPPKAYPSKTAAERAAKRDAGISYSHPTFKQSNVDYRGMTPKGTMYERKECNVGSSQNPRYVAIDDHHSGHPNLDGNERPHVHVRPGEGVTGRDYNHGFILGNS